MTAREAALKALYSIDADGAYINAALSAAQDSDKFSVSDRALITELIYGVVSERTAEDYIISRFSKVKIKKMTPWILNILRMGIYQIYFMDRIPQSAACNEAVKLAKRYSHRAGAGFVNGVLRSAARAADGFEFPKTGDVVKDLSLEYSYPEWITKRLVGQYGAEKCEALYAENRRPHPPSIRVNTLKTDVDTLAELLAGEGIVCEKIGGLENCLKIKGGIDIKRSKAYNDGLYSLQNISSQLAVKALDPKRGETIIDMCAAPGGKSCAAAERMENCGKILSFDIYEHKTELIAKSANRLGIDIIQTKTADSAEYDSSLFESADRVLADVPCSGLGVIHKKPDIKYSRREKDILSLTEIQAKILNNAARYVKKGGVLVYSTCTILAEENGGQIQRFLTENTNFNVEYEKQILTGADGESGFYICRMAKNS